MNLEQINKANRNSAVTILLTVVARQLLARLPAQDAADIVDQATQETLGAAPDPEAVRAMIGTIADELLGRP